MADAPNSRNTGDNISGGNISDRNPEPEILRLYSAMMVMVPLRLVSWDWISPMGDVASSVVAALPPSLVEAEAASLICCRRARTDSDGPSSQYFRTSASLALRTKTPMAPREVELLIAPAVVDVDGSGRGGRGGEIIGAMKHWIEGRNVSKVVKAITMVVWIAAIMFDTGLELWFRFSFMVVVVVVDRTTSMVMINVEGWSWLEAG
jgi:hypothetical protein